ncbi:DUF2190 family protein [Campylobacter fetus]|uniref:DUF2190 family protein n=1 Tax=Campylobacter fetus TaxID=196 RepID=UPI0011C87CE0|nr:DUF2190 family protein [Campylobacter fetus]EAJ1232633.1 DUF2190 family protein [Campylobacter fetus]EAK0414688.1 DUF2190 family protein [Campylobacter fetus]TXF09196.1 DUF2190 family protein [Campylobacter fetus subsp. fetus]
MAINLRDGNTIYYAHSAAVKKGDIIFLDSNSYALFALNDAMANEQIAYSVSGVQGFKFDTTKAATLIQGAKAYYDTSKKQVTDAAGTNAFYLGRVHGINSNVIEVKIN